MYPSEKYERFAIGSLVDLKNFDKNKFPLFEQSELIKVTLDEGDCLYLPRGWWHYTESFEPSINVSMHYWKLNGVFKDVITGLMKMFLHNIGLYKKHSCACHTFNKKGQRLLRS